MRAALRRLAASLVAALLSCFALAGAGTDNYQGLWWNAPPGSESGWGLGIAHQGDAIMATWFTYDDAGQGLWLVLIATRSGNDTFAGTVYQTSMPGRSYFATLPFDPSRVRTLAVGQGTLGFRDGGNGTLRYSVRGVEGSKSIAREVFGTLPACSYSAQPELANAANYTDLWWAASGGESGWGITLEHQDDVLFAAWFTYDTLGAPRWLVATAPRIAGNVYSGTLFRTTGPPFAAPFFDPAAVKPIVAGTATFTFSNGNAATFTSTIDGVTRTRALSRQLFAPPAGTWCRKATTASLQGRVLAEAGVVAKVCADANANGLCDPDEAQATSGADGAYTLAASAGYTGALLAETAGGYRMSSPGVDYSTNITPYTTLVRLTGERDFAIAELMVRNELGLPPRFPIRLDAPPAEGSLAWSVAGAIVQALRASSVGTPGPDALARVVAAFPSALTVLPQLRITTRDGAAIASKEVYVDATFVLTNPAAAAAGASLAGRIRGRGNMTWVQPKKPYKVQFANDAAYKALPDVLGMAKNRNWALLADYLDTSLLRNQLAFALGNSSLFAEGLKWTPSAMRVEVWLNGEYEGLYTLVEDIRVDPARLDIKAIGAGDLDGGYLVEVDYPLDCYNDGTIDLQHVTPQGVHVCLKTPDEGSATRAQIAWIRDYIDAAERDLYERGTTDRLNLSSYADWYLLNEFLRNYDAPFFSSDYMWKDSAAAKIPGDRLLNMGPIWDFDLSAGNIEAAGNGYPSGCWVDVMRVQDPAFPELYGDPVSNWYTVLRDNRDFVDLVTTRWKQKHSALLRLVDASIATYARRIGAAAARNSVRWPSSADWGASVASLRSFLERRAAWMDEAFATPASFSALCR